MSDHEKSDDVTEPDVTRREPTNEGEYTDSETESGRDTHKTDVLPGEYTDSDLGDQND